MKKLDFGTISAGLDTLQNTLERNSGIGWSELVAADAIDFAEKNTYAADDTDETIRELADQIEVAGLLSPLGVIKEGNRYRLFSGERRYRAITTYLHWEKIPCQVFEGVSANKAQLMLHMANAAREYSPARKLELYEEYNALLRKMKENGEFSGGVQKGVAELLNVSDRQVRTYRTMAERLTPEEKEAVKFGEISFGEAKQVAADRAAKEKNGTGSGFKREAAVKEADREEIPKQTIPIPSDGKAAPIKQTGTSCGFDPVNLTEQSREEERWKQARQIRLQEFQNNRYPRLMLEETELEAGDTFTALFPDGWHEVTLDIDLNETGVECWYISTPGYKNISLVGLFAVP